MQSKCTQTRGGVAEAWDRAKDTKSIAALDAFISRYKARFMVTWRAAAPVPLSANRRERHFSL